MSLNFAIIGAGNIAKVQVEAIKHIPGARVAVVSNRTEATGRALAGSCGADWTADVTEAVSRSDVDIVSICTPSGAHTEPAVTAAKAGKHLMVEKPIEITLPRIAQIIDAAESYHVKLTCFFPSRFMLGVEKAKEAIDQGRLGDLVFGDAYVKWYRSQEYYDTDWRGTWALDGGGALMNQSIHSIDMLQWLAGPVKNVFARTATLNHQMETEDTAAALIDFESGGMGVIQGATSCWPGEPARVELHGTKGTITLEEGRITTWNLADAGEAEKAEMLSLEAKLGSGSQDPMGISFEKHRRQILDMISAIENDHDPIIPGDEARKAVAIILAIYESSRTGQSVAPSA
jgi:predicted dehydrogenase